MADDEIFDVVDHDDKIIGQASRKEVHEKSLLHRAVHIMVFNCRNELFLQKRSLTKDENPGLWDTSAAGHVGAGEKYFATAHRELEEELGIRAELEFICKFAACDETAKEHLEIYKCVSDDQITINLDEISEGRFWPQEEIRKALHLTPELFTTSFKLIYSNYLKKKG